MGWDASPRHRFHHSRTVVSSSPIHPFSGWHFVVFANDHRTVTISSHSERLLHELGVPAQQTAWVGAELASLFPPAAMPSRREAAGLHLVSVSRLAEGYKNFEVVLRAVAVLAQSGLVESYTIVGDGPRRAALGERIDHLGLQNVVHMPGRLDDTGLAKVLQAAHVGLFPSRDSVAEGGFEGFGIVVQELAAAGLPVIVGGVAGATDAARPEWATIVDPDNVREWVEAIAAHARDEPMRHQRAMLAYDFGTTLDTTRTAADVSDRAAGRTARTRREFRRTWLDRSFLMCGIVGSLGYGAVERTHALLGQIGHRGPDGRGTWASGPVAGRVVP